MKNMIKKTLSRILASVMSIVTVVSIFTLCGISASATSTTYIVPGQYRLESAAKSGVMMNLYGNRSANQTKVCTWVKDNSREQILCPKYEGNGAYRIYFADYPTKCVDSLRYNNPLQDGQKIECYDNNDAVAQLVVPYKVDNYTVIFRMKSNLNLAISINKTENGSQLVLRKFNPSDKKQQFVFRSTDSSFKKVNAFTTKEPNTATGVKSTGLNGIPASAYSVIYTYTIYGTKYYYCQTTKAYNGFSKGTAFYLKAANKSVVNDTNTLKKLATIQLVNDIRSQYSSTLISMKSATAKTLDCAASWNRNAQLTKLLGTSGGAGLRAVFDCSTGNPELGLINCGKTIATSLAEPETSLACTAIVVLKALSADTIYYCNLAINQLKKPITDYSVATSTANNIASAVGYYHATMKLGRPILDDIVVSSPWKTTIVDLGMSLLDGAIGDDIGLVKATSIVQNVKSVSDFFTVFKVKDAYNQNYSKIKNTLILA